MSVYINRNTPSRRKILSGIGVSFATNIVTGLSAGKSENGKVNDKDEIKFAVKKGRPVYKKVPADWKAHVKKVLRERDNLQHQYKGDEDIKSVGINRDGNRGFGPYDGFSIKVNVTSESAAQKLPDKFRGVPVETKYADNDTEAKPLSCYNDGWEGDIMAGIEASNATIGSIVKVNGSDMFTTAHHAVADQQCSGDEEIGDSVYRNGSYIGSIYDTIDRGDVALVDIPDSFDSQNAILESEDDYHTDPRRKVISDQKGYVSLWGVIDLYNRGSLIHNTGITTGTTVGKIEASLDSDKFNTGAPCVDLFDAGAKISAEVAPGDSGSANYYIDEEGDALLVSLTSAVAPGANEVGTSCNGRSIWNANLGAFIYQINAKSDIDITWGY